MDVAKKKCYRSRKALVRASGDAQDRGAARALHTLDKASCRRDSRCLWMPSKSVLGRNNETVHQGVAGKGQEGPQRDRGNGQTVGKALALSCRKIRNALCCTKDPLQKKNTKIAQYSDPKSRPDEQAVGDTTTAGQRGRAFAAEKKRKAGTSFGSVRGCCRKRNEKAFEMVEGE